jgi:hypothetical protein
VTKDGVVVLLASLTLVTFATLAAAGVLSLGATQVVIVAVASFGAAFTVAEVHRLWQSGAQPAAAAQTAVLLAHLALNACYSTGVLTPTSNARAIAVRVSLIVLIGFRALTIWAARQHRARTMRSVLDAIGQMRPVT